MRQRSEHTGSTARAKMASRGLIAAFAAVLLLMIAALLFGLAQLEKIERDQRHLVELYYAKGQLLLEMRLAARERTLRLHQMVMTDDPFARDEMWMDFNHHGAVFARNRERLLAMELGSEERALLAAQANATRKSIPVQLEIAELALNDDVASAKVLLGDAAVPLQNAVFEQMQALVDHQRALFQRLMAAGKQAYVETQRLVIIAGILAVLAAIGIATSMLRRTFRAEDSLTRQKEFAETTLQSIADGVITTDARGRVVNMNPTAEILTGRNREAVRGTPLVDVFRIADEEHSDPIDLSALRHSPETGDNDGAPLNGRLLSARGEEYCVRYSLAPICSTEHNAGGAVLVFHDETETRALNQQLHYHANHDTLTGLCNRREFEVRLTQAIRSAASEGVAHGLVVMDLDRFKAVNDTCGHVAGDELLKRLAQTLNSRIRQSDVLARLGGDEFALILEGCRLEKSRKLAETLRRTIADFEFSWQGRSFRIGASIGLVEITEHTATVSDALMAADTACYVAKDQGRNRVHVYGSGDQNQVTREKEMQWLPRIRDALEADRLCLFAQQIVPIGNDTRARAEVLVRMRDGDGGMISPRIFIPAAERYGLMTAVDKWVVRHTLDKISADDAGWQLSINLSGQSLSEPDFLGFLMEAFEQSRVAPDRVCFEITETCAITNFSHALRLIATLRGIGCAFALDDFGSGLSSYSYLKNLNLDYLKIDGGFITAIESDPANRAIVGSIKHIATSMGFKTVAECVEDDATVAVLRDIGVDYVQGRGVHRPVPVEELLRGGPTAADSAEPLIAAARR